MSFDPFSNWRFCMPVHCKKISRRNEVICCWIRTTCLTFRSKKKIFWNMVMQRTIKSTANHLTFCCYDHLFWNAYVWDKECRSFGYYQLITINLLIFWLLFILDFFIFFKSQIFNYKMISVIMSVQPISGAVK